MITATRHAGCPRLSELLKTPCLPGASRRGGDAPPRSLPVDVLAGYRVAPATVPAGVLAAEGTRLRKARPPFGPESTPSATRPAPLSTERPGPSKSSHRQPGMAPGSQPGAGLRSNLGVGLRWCQPQAAKAGSPPGAPAWAYPARVAAVRLSPSS